MIDFIITEMNKLARDFSSLYSVLEGIVARANFIYGKAAHVFQDGDIIKIVFGIGNALPIVIIK